MDKISPIKERVLSFIENKRVTKQEFCEKTGISYANLKGKGLLSEIGGQQIGKILSFYPEISPEWLLTGKGNMLKSHQEGELVPDPSKGKKLIPFYDDVTTIGGCNSISAAVDGCMPALEYIDTGDWFPDATAAIRHYGESMIEYPSGSILAIRRVNDHRLIINGRNYVIETTEFRITKQLQYDGGDYITAYSSNRNTYPDGRQIHAPIRIPIDTIRHIDIILGCVTKEYSNGGILFKK